jgi:hypothetical protein
MPFWNRTPAAPPLDLDKVKRAIVRVGNGRGFMVGGGIVTTTNWLANPPKFRFPRFSTNDEALHAAPDESKILAALGNPLTISAYCVFADPVSHVAILSNNSEDYRGLDDWKYRLEIHAPLRPHIAGAGRIQDVWFLSLDEKWVKCQVRVSYDNLTFVGPNPNVFGGEPEIDGRLSGSPIIDEEGRAIGMILAPTKAKDRDEWTGHHVVLIRQLPGKYIASISELGFPER